MLAWIVWAGCTGPTTDPGPGTPPDTGPAPPRPACAVEDDNALRIVCLYERDGTGPVEVRVRTAGEPPVTIPGNAGSRSVYVVALDLRANTSYDWELDDRGAVVEEGTLTTGTLPDLFRPAYALPVDGPSSIDRLLFPMSCGSGTTLYITDALGQVRWYQPIRTTGSVAGFDYTDRGTIVVNLGRTRVMEWEPDGRVVLDVEAATEMERIPHHGIVSRDGRIWVLDTASVPYTNGKSYLVDGVSEVTAEAGGVHVWDLGGLVDPQVVPVESGAPRDPAYWSGMFGDAIDFAHENSIDVMENGDWLISLKHLDTLLRIDGAGEVRWSLAGMPSAAVFTGPALELRSSTGIDPTFQYPHHPNPTPWGTVLVVDNGWSPDENTRILELVIDEEAGVADAVRAWDLGVYCPVQSSAWGLPDGTIVASCAASHEVFELDDSGIRRRSSFSCADGEFTGAFVRAEPVPRVTGYAR